MALINVAKLKILCPICGKSDWCMISQDFKLSLCQRIANNHPNQKGGWWYSLQENISYDKSTFVQNEKNPKASDEILDRIYKDLLNSFPLSNEHKNVLRNRGLIEQEIEEQGYRTLPIQGRSKVVKELLDRYKESTLSNIPGLYVKEGEYGDFWTIFGGSGFMIPIKNIDQLIVGIQVRVDQPTARTKYIWLSSAGKKNGTNSGACLHVAVPPKITNNNIWITEGPLKANVIAWRKKCISIAAPGIAHWRNIPKTISLLRKGLNTSGRNIIAYDAEFDIKPWVKENAILLAEELKIEKHDPFFAKWDLRYGKGIDDVIISGNEPIIVTKEML